MTTEFKRLDIMPIIRTGYLSQIRQYHRDKSLLKFLIHLKRIKRLSGLISKTGRLLPAFNTMARRP